MFTILNIQLGHGSPLRTLDVGQNMDENVSFPVSTNSSDSGNDTISFITPSLLDLAFNFTESQPACYPGTVLNLASCEDVFQKIPNTGSAILDSQGNKISTPVRYSSCKSRRAAKIADLILSTRVTLQSHYER